MRLDSLTDIGVKRKENQDNYWGALLSSDGIETGVICLCDGMGGLNNGGLASKIVVEFVRDAIKDGMDFIELADVIKSANSTVHELGLNGSRMGTTCTLIQCQDSRYKVHHVGDSRCYLLRGNELVQITTDHSALKKYGITKESNIELWKKYKNSLTRCIGVKPSVELDYYEGDYIEGDIFLVCSDGLWHYLENKNFSPDKLSDLRLLIKSCIQEGETDNISIGVLYV